MEEKLKDLEGVIEKVLDIWICEEERKVHIKITPPLQNSSYYTVPRLNNRKTMTQKSHQV